MPLHACSTLAIKTTPEPTCIINRYITKLVSAFDQFGLNFFFAFWPIWSQVKPEKKNDQFGLRSNPKKQNDQFGLTWTQQKEYTFFATKYHFSHFSWFFLSSFRIMVAHGLINRQVWIRQHRCIDQPHHERLDPNRQVHTALHSQIWQRIVTQVRPQTYHTYHEYCTDTD